jgi:alkylation response protein AidB-like acyl-CoA dehydrogenase
MAARRRFPVIEQSELRDAARKLLADIATAPTDEAWRRIVQAGWPALTAPASLGGLEQALSPCCWLYAEMGGALSSAPLLASLLAVATLTACAPSPIRDAWIERIAAGEHIAVSLLNPSRDAGPVRGLHAVLGAARATHVLVVLGNEPLVAIMPLDGISTAVARPTWDATRDLFDLEVGNVHSDGATVIARGAVAEAALSAFSTHLHVAIAADCVGAAARILDETIPYLKTRHQFNRPLAMFQALKHRCADLKATVLAAEALLLAYVADIDRGCVGGDVLARGAKSIASSAFRAVAEDAMQLHGGIAMAAEHPCHLYLKRALLNEQLGSDNDACDTVVGSRLFCPVAA